MDEKIYILHTFNARPYFEAVEYYAKMNNIKVEYIETNWLKSTIKVILRKKCINCNIKSIVKNLLFTCKIPFIKNRTIIYGTAPYDFRFLWYSLARKKNNLIYHTSHHKWGDDKSSVFLYGLLTPMLKKYWKNILDDNKIKIVAVTKKSQQTLKYQFGVVSKVYQIYHSIDLKRFEVKSKELGKKIKILYVGRLVYEKGLDVLVDVIHKVDTEKYEFTIVGDGDYKEKIISIFRKENVNYLGWISDKEKIASIFNTHDILLNPSIKYKDWEELFGIVNIEAMASGMVVIASDHIGPKEIITHNLNGLLVEENNPEIIVTCLNALFENQDKLYLLSKHAIDKAKDFSIKHISKQWAGVINE